MRYKCLPKALKNQIKFIKSKALYPCFCGGYGSGKTEALVYRAMDLLYQGEHRVVCIYAPTYGLLRDIHFPKFENILSLAGINYIPNKTAKEIAISRTKKIIFRTLENPEMIIGYEVHDSIIDELDVLPTSKAIHCWSRIIARNRLKKDHGENTVAVTTTPEGFKFVYNKWVKEKNGPEYELIKTKTTDNPFLPSSYVENLKMNYDDKLLMAYLEGEFINLQYGQVYYEFNRDKFVVDGSMKLDPTLPVAICVDFNVDPMIWMVCQSSGREEINVLYEIYLSNTNTWDMCIKLKSLIPSSFSVVIYGDASGRSRDTRGNYSDYSIIDEEFRSYFSDIKYMVPKSNPPVRNRVNCVNNMLSKNSIKISKECKELVSDLEEIAYNDKGDIDKSNLKRTHASDAFGYFIATEFPIKPIVVSESISF